jgi:hypothetical protein
MCQTTKATVQQVYIHEFVKAPPPAFQKVIDDIFVANFFFFGGAAFRSGVGTWKSLPVATNSQNWTSNFLYSWYILLNFGRGHHVFCPILAQG